MPVLTLGQVISTATTLAGGRNDWTVSEASFWANLALEEIEEVAGINHVPLEAIAVSSTTSGGNRIALPSDFNFPLSFTLYQGSSATTGSKSTTIIELIQRDTEYLDKHSDQFNSGVPSYYAWTATWLELFPSPDSAYSLQLRYTAKQASLISSTETPSLAPKWHQAWLLKTAEKLCASRSDGEGEGYARNRYLNYITVLRTDQGDRQQDVRSMSMRFGGQRYTRGGY